MIRRRPSIDETSSPKQEAPPEAPPRPFARPAAAVLTIPQGLELRGEVVAKQSLKIEGTIEGRIHLDGHDLSIEPRANVRADIRARSVVVRGCLDGNIEAKDRVEITARGKVRGQIRARRVVLADGATFNGSINREPTAATAVKETGRPIGVFVPRLGVDERSPSTGGSRTPAGLSLWTLVEAKSDH